MLARHSKLTLFLSLLVWLLILLAFMLLNITQNWEAQRQVQLETTRSFFQLIVATRDWNSNMGGVFVPITSQVQPNPYLQTPNRDLECSNGLKLTKINPAYMTRLISELTEKQTESVRIHITSLKPIRPENEATAWEKTALTAFEQNNEPELFDWEIQSGTVRYMAPLITRTSCLACHAQQGYKEGQIRGGISIAFRSKRTFPWAIVLSLGLVAAIGGLVIFSLGKQLSASFMLLDKQAHVDELTQIHNRRHFDQALEKEFQLSKIQPKPVSIIICDVDFFKSYNDLYGHGAGDECLKQVAGALKETLKRPTDTLARIGGEEFGILLPNTPSAGAYLVAEALRANVEKLHIPHASNQLTGYVTISLGLWTYSGESIDALDVLKKADQALYQAKKAGRNRVSVASE